MNYELDYEFLKGFLFPTLDLFLKLVIGIFLAIYLFKRGKKDKIKDLVIELFQNIGEELSELQRIRYEYSFRRVVYMVSPEPIPIQFCDKLKPKIAENAVEHEGELVVTLDFTGRHTTEKIRRYLSRLELLIGETEYDNAVKGLIGDINMYLFETGTTMDFDSEILENTKEQTAKHYKNFKENIITKGEYADFVLMDTCPLFDDMNKKLNQHWDKLIYPHLKSLRRSIHKI